MVRFPSPPLPPTLPTSSLYNTHELTSSLPFQNLPFIKAHDHHRNHHTPNRDCVLVPVSRLAHERVVPEPGRAAPRRATHQSQPDGRGEQALEVRSVSYLSFFFLKKKSYFRGFGYRFDVIVKFFYVSGRLVLVLSALTEPLLPRISLCIGSSRRS